jgi:hypothetical protein
MAKYGLLFPLVVAAAVGCTAIEPPPPGGETQQVVTSALTSADVAVPVPFDRPAARPQSAGTTAVGADHPTADAPNMPPWRPAHKANTCTATSAPAFPCSSDAPNPALCDSRSDLPAACHYSGPVGALFPPGRVPVCCQ